MSAIDGEAVFDEQVIYAENRAQHLDNSEKPECGGACGGIGCGDENCGEEEDQDDREDLDEGAMQDFLQEAIEEYAANGPQIHGAHVRTFAESGVLSKNNGLVIRVGGREFQITIVQSK